MAIKIGVVGAAGRMGQMLVREIVAAAGAEDPDPAGRLVLGDEVVALHQPVVPPAGLDAFWSGQQGEWPVPAWALPLLAQGLWRVEQPQRSGHAPCRKWCSHRRAASGLIDRGCPVCRLRAMIGDDMQPLHLFATES